MNLTEFFESSNFVSSLFELDEKGTVLYLRLKRNGQNIEPTNHLFGKNLLDDLLDFDNTADFMRLFRNFVLSRQFTDNFNFNFQHTERHIPVQVMLLRASEANQSELRDILVLDIRKNNN